MVDYREVDRAYWDERAPAHAASPDFAFDAYASDPERISDIVRFDLPLLGDVSGLEGVHRSAHENSPPRGSTGSRWGSFENGGL